MATGGQYTMGSGVDTPWVGWGRYAMDRGQNTTGSGINIPWVGGLIYHG